MTFHHIRKPNSPDTLPNIQIYAQRELQSQAKSHKYTNSVVNLKWFFSVDTQTLKLLLLFFLLKMAFKKRQLNFWGKISYPIYGCHAFTILRICAAIWNIHCLHNSVAYFPDILLHCCKALNVPSAKKKLHFICHETM